MQCVSAKDVEAYVASWIEINWMPWMWMKRIVETYVVSWIEICMLWSLPKTRRVEAYVASWIEISCPAVPDPYILSRLM